MADITVTNIDEALWHTHTPDEIAAGASQDLRYCFLVDKALQNSHGLSLGCLILPAGAELPPHTHQPQEAYFIKREQASSIYQMAQGAMSEKMTLSIFRK